MMPGGSAAAGGCSNGAAARRTVGSLLKQQIGTSPVPTSSSPALGTSSRKAPKYRVTSAKPPDDEKKKGSRGQRVRALRGRSHRLLQHGRTDEPCGPRRAAHNALREPPAFHFRR